MENTTLNHLTESLLEQFEKMKDISFDDPNFNKCLKESKQVIKRADKILRQTKKSLERK